MENIIVGSAGFTAGAAVTALILAMSRVAYMLDGANRTGMDTPPGFMTLVWPLIKLIDFFVAANLPIKVIENVDSKLQKSAQMALKNSIEQYETYYFLEEFRLKLDIQPHRRFLQELY